jgi:hypothetical protein
MPIAAAAAPRNVEESSPERLECPVKIDVFDDQIEAALEVLEKAMANEGVFMEMKRRRAARRSRDQQQAGTTPGGGSHSSKNLRRQPELPDDPPAAHGVPDAGRQRRRGPLPERSCDGSASRLRLRGVLQRCRGGRGDPAVPGPGPGRPQVTDRHRWRPARPGGRRPARRSRRLRVWPGPAGGWWSGGREAALPEQRQPPRHSGAQAEPLTRNPLASTAVMTVLSQPARQG